MRTLRRLHSHIARLVCLVMLAAALLPSVALAVGAEASTGWIEICTANGVKRISSAGPAPDTGSGEHGSALPDHCPLCTLTASNALPPADALLFIVQASVDRRDARPPASTSYPSPLRRSAQPRAPPVFS